MSFYRGRLPHLTNAFSCACATYCSAALRILLLAATALAAVSAQAQQDIPLTLAEAERLALSDEPGYKAFLARAEALDERSVLAGQLPNPKLRLILNHPRSSLH